MNWVFLDFIRWDYDVGTPAVRPLGGSQSALCYLASALAARGDRVTTLTGTTQPREVNGVRCLHYQEIPVDVFTPDNTVVVVLNGPGDVVHEVRAGIGPHRPIVLWTQHAHDQPAMQPLLDPSVVSAWNRLVCISEWQKGEFQSAFGIAAEKIDVLRNAISPFFENLFSDAAALADAKSRGLRLVYTSTPFRGLDVLLACFPALHRRHPHCRLDIFSSMQVYGQAESEDPYRALYAQCQTMPGVNYRGSVSQSELAKELAGASLFAYPNTFAETSCIAAMEALAAGLLVVTSNLGALPETCAGFARLLEPVSQTRTHEQFAIDFARHVDRELTELQANPTAWMQQRFDQSRAINANCNWALRASEWRQAAERWLSNP